MRLGFDVRYISHGLTGGVRTYVYHLARALPMVAPEHEFFYYADDKAPFELQGLPPNVIVRTMPWTGTLSSVVNDVRLAKWMERDRLDLVHSPGNYGPPVRIPLVLTLHDTINLFPILEHARGFSRRPRQLAMMAYLGWMTRASLRRAARVITVSNHARRDIHERTGYPLSRLTVVHEAASPHFRPIADRAALQRARKRWDLGPSVILADGIKNPDAAIAAFDELGNGVDPETQLVFFSREQNPRAAVQRALANARVRFIPRPSDEELVTLFNIATVFVLPSWYEGFGLPLVEAMQCGTPVIGSTRGSIPEVIGDAGLVFEVEEPRQLAHALRVVLGDGSVRTHLSEQARRRAAHFNWERAARETLDVYRQVLQSDPSTVRVGASARGGAVQDSVRG